MSDALLAAFAVIAGASFAAGPDRIAAQAQSSSRAIVVAEASRRRDARAARRPMTCWPSWSGASRCRASRCWRCRARGLVGPARLVQPVWSAELPCGSRVTTSGSFARTGIYTPQLVVDGQFQAVGSDAAAVRQALLRAARIPKAAVTLATAVGPARDRARVDVRVSGPTAPALGSRADVLIAIVEDDLVTHVRRGENGGRTLQHTAVVRVLRAIGALAQGDRASSMSTSVLFGADWAFDRLRAIAFLQERDTRRIIGARGTGCRGIILYLLTLTTKKRIKKRNDHEQATCNQHSHDDGRRNRNHERSGRTIPPRGDAFEYSGERTPRLRYGRLAGPDHLHTGPGGASGNAGGIATQNGIVAAVNFGSQTVAIFASRRWLQLRQLVPAVSAPVSVAFSKTHLYVLGLTTVESHRIVNGEVDPVLDGMTVLLRADGWPRRSAWPATAGDQREERSRRDWSRCGTESWPAARCPCPCPPAKRHAVGLVTRGAHPRHHRALRSDRAGEERPVIAAAATGSGFPNGPGQQSPCWIALVGPYLYSANTPSHSISRLVATGGNVILDEAVAALVPGNPGDIAGDGDVLAVIESDGGNPSHLTLFSIGEGGEPHADRDGPRDHRREWCGDSSGQITARWEPPAGPPGPVRRPLTYSRSRRIKERKRCQMVQVGLLARLEVKPGKEAAVTELLTGALALANAEPATTVWFAIRLGQRTFGIFDAFPDEAGRDAHLAGPIAAALMANAAELLSQPPVIERVRVLAAKL